MRTRDVAFSSTRMIGVVGLHGVVVTAPTERSDMRISTTEHRGILTSLAAIAAAAVFAMPAAAAPTSPGALTGLAAVPAFVQGGNIEPGATVERAQYRGRNFRGRGHGRRHWGRGWQRGQWGQRRGYGYRGYRGPSIAGAIAGALIGGSIVASKRSHGGAWQRCDDRYVSFRSSDGTFQPYGGGPRQLCPYLRN